MELPGTVWGIPGYLVTQDPWDSMPGGTTWDCPRYPGILSTGGDNLGPSGYVMLGVPYVFRDVPSCPRTTHGSSGHEHVDASIEWQFWVHEYINKLLKPFSKLGKARLP